jgi:hypothetical protein
MFKYCPKCGAEYNPTAIECADCLVPLVIEPPAKPQPAGKVQDKPLELVAVFQTSDLGEMAYAKSLLEEAGIPFLARNELLQDLFGFGRAVPVNPVTGPVIFQVPAEDVELAREILAVLLEDEEEQAGDSFD